MAKLRLELTDEHIRLIKNFRISEYGDQFVGIDNYDMYGGSFLFEDMGLILGLNDKILPGTLEDYDGAKYEQETMEHMKDLDAFIVGNLKHIEDILHQFCTEGISAGVYECNDRVGIWKRVEEEKKDE